MNTCSVALTIIPLLLACNGSPDRESKTDGPVSVDAAGPEQIEDPAPRRGRCPSDWIDAPHSSPCDDRGLTCSWGRTLDTVVAVCDGHFWRVVARDIGCAKTPPAGMCGQFEGTCGYIIDSIYPGGEMSDFCSTNCSCTDGTWKCESSCACPGNPNDEALDYFGEPVFRELEGACFHDKMTCSYDYKTGSSSPTAADRVGQPCLTTFTCNAGKWGHISVCSCPFFPPGEKDYSPVCRSESSLQCMFPAVDSESAPRKCRCQEQRWECAESR